MVPSFDWTVKVERGSSSRNTHTVCQMRVVCRNCVSYANGTEIPTIIDPVALGSIIVGISVH